MAAGDPASYDTGMRRAEALRIIANHASEIRALGVRSLSLFGSVARDQAGQQSDVDLLIDFDHAVGLFEFFRVQRALEGMLGRRVDLVMRDAIKRQLRERILGEAVLAA